MCRRLRTKSPTLASSHREATLGLLLVAALAVLVACAVGGGGVHKGASPAAKEAEQIKLAEFAFDLFSIVKKCEYVGRAYQALTTKPTIPEEAHRYSIQAEDAVKNGELPAAAAYYAKALEVAFWWPEGHFNRAIVVANGNSTDISYAISDMKCYLSLVPNAPDSRQAQDLIYVWERKALVPVIEEPKAWTLGSDGKPKLGVLIDNLDLLILLGQLPAGSRGALITFVRTGMPAERAGLIADDVVLTFDGKPVSKGEDLVAAVTAAKSGASVMLEVLRKGQRIMLKVRLDAAGEN